MAIEKHTTYFNFLDALKEHGCPLCRLSDRSVYSYFDAFLFENVTDQEVSTKIRSAGGFCKAHAKKLVEFNDALAISLVYEALIYDLVSGKDGIAFAKGSRCPACSVEQESEERQLKAFGDYFTEKEFEEAYLKSDGFCVAHLKQVLPLIKKKEVLKKVADKERGTLIKLQEELKEFIRKNDYRFSKEAWGAEKDSWRRAVTKLIGNDSMKEKLK